MQQVITNEQEFDLNVAFVTGGGQPATVEGVPAWSNSNDAAVTVAPAEDGLSAVVTSVDAGTSAITVTAQTPSGNDVVGVFAVEVVSAEAATVEFIVENVRLKVTSDGSNTPE